jgi:hypothetical protein
MAPFGWTDKSAEKALLADLLWEKNTVPAEKTSWKRRIISRVNRLNIHKQCDHITRMTLVHVVDISCTWAIHAAEAASRSNDVHACTPIPDGQPAARHDESADAVMSFSSSNKRWTNKRGNLYACFPVLISLPYHRWKLAHFLYYLHLYQLKSTPISLGLH